MFDGGCLCSRSVCLYDIFQGRRTWLQIGYLGFVAALFGMSVEESVSHGAAYADISCLMAMMIFTEEEFDSNHYSRLR